MWWLSIQADFFPVIFRYCHLKILFLFFSLQLVDIFGSGTAPNIPESEENGDSESKSEENILTQNIPQGGRERMLSAAMYLMTAIKLGKQVSTPV